MKRVELAALCKKHKPKPKYQISELAAKHGLKVLLLPVGHPEFNPIEMIWSMLKECVKKKNANYSLSDVEKYAHEYLDKFDASTWKNCIDHVKKIEENYLSVANKIPFSM